MAELPGGLREEALEQHGPDGAALTSPGGELTSFLVKNTYLVSEIISTPAHASIETPHDLIDTSYGSSFSV